MALRRLIPTLPRAFEPLHRHPHRACSTHTPPPPPPSSSAPSSNSASSSHRSDELTLLHDAILEQAPTHGFTATAIDAAIRHLGWSPAARAMLPRGPVEAVEEFSRRCDVALARRLESDDVQAGVGLEDGERGSGGGGSDGKGGVGGVGIRESSVGRAAFAIRTRIEMVEPVREHWPAAIKMRALPRNSPRAVYDSAVLADEIAHYAGFRLPDVSWYTDRAVVGLAYHTTELYWLTDNSEGREETWRFLDRRLRDSFQLRSGVTSAYTNLMTLSDATLGSVATLVRSSRRSY